MERFSISCWTYFPFSKAWDSLAQDYHDLGLTNPMTPVFREGDDPEKMIALLDQFHALGMRVIMYDDRVHIGSYRETGMDEATYEKLFQKSLDQFGWHPAISGFYVGDEPDAPEAEMFFMAARVQRRMAPHLVPFLNLLPWFDWIGERMGSPAYAPYLDRAVTEGDLAQIGYDCYTQMWKEDSGYDVYFNNLREMRDASNRHNIPFCNTLLSSGHYDYLCPDQDAFRWQISTTVALGAKAITYFYVAGIEPGANYRNFPLNHFHERTDTYRWLSEENRLFLERYADLFLKLTCEKSEFTMKPYGGLQLFAPDETLHNAYADDGLFEGGDLWHTGQRSNLLVSTFVDGENIRYRVAVNMDRKKNVLAKLRFAPGVNPAVLMWNETWKECGGHVDAVGAMSNDGADASQWLAPGQMFVIRENVE